MATSRFTNWSHEKLADRKQDNPNAPHSEHR